MNIFDRLLREGRGWWQLADIDPVEPALWLRSRLAERAERRKPRFRQMPYVVTEDWEQRLHEILGVSWPCQICEEFQPLWGEVLRPFEREQIRLGRGAFGGWGDGEPALTRVP
jgi:hypothetical protein